MGAIVPNKVSWGGKRGGAGRCARKSWLYSSAALPSWGSVLAALVMLLVATGCTVRPHLSGAYHGTSSSGGEASGSMLFSQPF